MKLKHNNVGLALGLASALALSACGSKTGSDDAMSSGGNEAMMTDEGGAMNSGDPMSSGNAMGSDDHMTSGNAMSSDAMSSGGSEAMATNAQ